MRLLASDRTKWALTLVELLVVVAIIGILFLMINPMRQTGDRLPARTGHCMSNLRQVSIGYLLYAEDHRDVFPWQASVTNMENQTVNLAITAAGCFAALTNYLHQPDVYVCPSDPGRTVAPTNFSCFGNSNLSYFASLDASINLTSTNFANIILSGDRHLAWNTSQVEPGLLFVTNFTAMNWTKELHWGKNRTTTLGVLAFFDGHVETVKREKLPTVFQRQAIAINRLVIP